MKAKYLVIMLLVFALAFGYTASGYAYGPGHGGMQGGKGKCHFTEEGKIFGAAILILKNKEEVGLTDEQVDKIKALKVETKKSLIRQNAEIDIVSVDLKAAEWKDPIDRAEVNKLIDRKYDLKKEKAKSLVAARAALKDILTDEQYAALKDFCKPGKEGRLRPPVSEECNLDTENQRQNLHCKSRRICI